MTREILSTRRQNEIREVDFGGKTYKICIGFYDDGRPGEVFCDGEKYGSMMQAIISDACVLISFHLQHGISPAEMGRSLGRVPAFINGKETDAPASIIGFLVEALGAE